MHRKLIITVTAVLLLAVGITWVAKARQVGPKVTATAAESSHGHEAHHGGCLNAIDTCAVGHAEVKLEDQKLRVWFVGGENDTGRAVRIPDHEITLTIRPSQGDESILVLVAKPNELAEETVGDCSCFEGTAEWLKGLNKFEATGKVRFKGQERSIRIEYPGGYDPDEEPGIAAPERKRTDGSPEANAEKGKGASETHHSKGAGE